LTIKGNIGVVGTGTSRELTLDLVVMLLLAPVVMSLYDGRLHKAVVPTIFEVDVTAFKAFWRKALCAPPGLRLKTILA
jgi:hypothetical protein